ncbi:MAG: putative ATP-dependent RNA helicase ddx49, partial [Paramarteilia canceri]
KDVIAIAKTGSGKTAAFALPVLKNLSSNPRPFYCLVVTPTRELAIQIKEQFEIFGKPINVRVLNVIGGIDVVDQSLELDEAPHIIVSTPGRLASFMRSSTKINLETTSYFVIDEADRLLDDGFGNDMAVIIEKLPKTRQTLLFTATITLSIESLMNKEEEKNNFFIWQEKSKILTVDSLDQKIILCPAYAKDVYFIHILDKFLEDNMHQSVMIFSNSCKYTQLLGMICDKINIKNVVLHSGMKQKDRAKSLAKFKSGLVRVIISTDIASRGLDIPMVDLVINHNVPFKPKDYVHRVGRTARAGIL